MVQPAAPHLRLETISKAFGDVQANRNVTLEIVPGQILALLGENGAGKSTLMSIVAGQLQPDEGTIYLDNQPVVFSSTEKAIEAGIGMVYQQSKLVEVMTVAENVFLGQRTGFWMRSSTMRKKVQQLADLYGMNVNPATLACDLSMGEKQQVEILKLLHRKSKVLIFDEPTSVLTPAEADLLFATMKVMAEEGKAIVFISHKLKEVLGIADSIAILRRGEIIDRFAASQVSSTTELAERMVGRPVQLEVEREPMIARQIVLKVEHLEEDCLQSASLELRKGEILGVIGVAGSGQKPLVESICGLRRPAKGAVRILGKDWGEFFSSGTWEHELSYIPEDRQGLATCQELDLVDNFLLTTRGDFVKGPWLHKEKAREKAAHLLQEFDIDADNLGALAGQLSGGNLQKMVLAREFYRKPRLIIAEQPTQGLDVAAAEYVRNLLLKAREQAGIMLVTSDLAEALALSDRIVVMYAGAIVACFAREDEEKVAAIPRMMAGLGL